MPLGLLNAPATFQSLMNIIFCDFIDDIVVIYLDDIVVYSNTSDEHLEHLENILSTLRENKLYVGQKECELMKSETEFLELQIGKEGVSVGEQRRKIGQE